MFKRFQYRAIQKKINRSLNKEGDSRGFYKIESVLILTDSTQNAVEFPIAQLASSLGLNSGQIKTLEFTLRKNKRQELLPNQISKEYFGIQGSFKPQLKPKLLNKQYHLVIAHYYKTNIFLDNVLAEQLNAFKSGVSGADGRLLDLAIASPPNAPEIFINELVKYLRVLQLTLQHK